MTPLHETPVRLMGAAAIHCIVGIMPPEPRVNIPEWSVSELAAALKKTVEDSYGFVRVRGEITGTKP